MVHDQSGPLGSVTFTVHGQTVRWRRPTLDVAVIEIAPERTSDLAPRMTIGLQVEGLPGATVICHGQKGPRSSDLKTFSKWLFVPRAQTVLVDVYQTFDSISDSGDSGAPVLAADGDVLVGMLVAGSAKESFIQAADSQLAATGCQLWENL
jgi:hypothetical protein